MKDLLMSAIQENVLARRRSVDQLDDKVVAFSKILVQEELRNHQSLIDNDYFMKISGTDFGTLPKLEQMMSLAFWHFERSLSSPRNHFYFESRKKIQGVEITFLVHLKSGGRTFRVAVEFDADEEIKVEREAMGLPVLSFSKEDALLKPLTVADDVFSFLSELAEAG